MQRKEKEKKTIRNSVDIGGKTRSKTRHTSTLNNKVETLHEEEIMSFELTLEKAHNDE